VRLLVCDYHVVLAEALADALTARGDEVVAVTHDLDTTLRVLASGGVDVCLLDVVFRGEQMCHRLGDLRRVAPRTHLVLLAARIDDALLAAGRLAGVSAVVHKSRPMSGITDLLDRLPSGGPTGGAPTVVAEAPATRHRPGVHRDVHRLAGFLTPRERQVLGLLVRGGDTKLVARSLGIAHATARCHIQSLLTKLGAHSRLEAATTAVRSGIVAPQTGEWLASARVNCRVARHVSDRDPSG
jgi:two-component system nitrate/nitrite response regulator NarL